MKRPDYIICAPLQWTFSSNGVLALVRLARSIEKTGRRAYMCTYRHVNGVEAAIGIDFDTYAPKNEGEQQFVGTIRRVAQEFGITMLKDFSQQHVDDCIVVYPEALLTNPLNAKRVVRYFLNREGIVSGRKVNVGPDDFILAHSRVMHPDPHHVCYFAELNPLFHNRGTHPAEHRQLDISYIGKGSVYGITDPVPETVVITRTWPETKQELAILLRNCRFFFTADACSNLNTEALACGAIPAFRDTGPWTNEDIDSFEPAPFPRLYEGVQAGDDFFAEFEKERLGYLERLQRLIDGWDDSVAQMADKADVHFALRPHTAPAPRDTAPASAAGRVTA
ncbi:hypothetical protein [Caballeronia telluris]|uniref:Glycosyltransferase-like protein n=1 Tax=Caballeronia telluris TaxID=326475 RepID=A0A158J7Z8_9BURK|nr:hypothetical protein [Caballeronia telluris]SAL64593.1 glycosyltransferase-like protein [Caballeronia telluris]